MRAIVRLVAVAALFVGLVPETASAQRWTWDLSLHGGYSMWTNMSDQDKSGVEEISFDSGPLGGAQLGWWGNRFGLRLNAAYESRETLVGAGDDSDKATALGESNIWAGSLDAMFRFRAPNETWMGSEFLPYLALGLGGRWVNPPGDDDTAICVDPEEDETWACAMLSGTGTNRVAMGEQKGLLGHVGLGADWRLSPRFALRLEAFDRISKPQLYIANPSTTTTPTLINLPNGDELVSKWAHELGFQAGLNFLFGLKEVAPVVVVTPPAPPPPPPPAPAEPAPPREEAVTVCVIDLSATGGTRMQAATYRIQQRDTVVMVNGQARPLRESVGNIMVARDAGWVVRGEPLNLTIGNETIRFLPYQGINRIDGNQVVYLGNINGYPVYANRNEVADVVTAINTARGNRTDADLGTLLVNNRQARDVIQNVQYLYVPADPYGCTFQPIQPQQDVRKGGK